MRGKRKTGSTTIRTTFGNPLGLGPCNSLWEGNPYLDLKNRFSQWEDIKALLYAPLPERISVHLSPKLIEQLNMWQDYSLASKIKAALAEGHLEVQARLLDDSAVRRLIRKPIQNYRFDLFEVLDNADVLQVDLSAVNGGEEYIVGLFPSTCGARLLPRDELSCCQIHSYPARDILSPLAPGEEILYLNLPCKARLDIKSAIQGLKDLVKDGKLSSGVLEDNFAIIDILESFKEQTISVECSAAFVPREVMLKTGHTALTIKSDDLVGVENEKAGFFWIRAGDLDLRPVQWIYETGNCSEELVEAFDPRVWAKTRRRLSPLAK